MEITRRNVLMTGGLVSGAMSVGTASRLFAIEDVVESSDQPGDAVGEETRRARIMELLERFGDDPVDMLNLLKFKAGREDSYARYGMEFGRLVPKFAPGTEVIYMAECAELLVGGQDWDRLIVVRYPSVKAFVALTGSPDYDQIAHLRTDALERAVLYALVPAQA
jgi:uncharacterized protein (DUF1330 family)